MEMPGLAPGIFVWRFGLSALSRGPLRFVTFQNCAHGHSAALPL